MKFAGLITLLGLSFFPMTGARAADATQPVDYTRRNATFLPAPTVNPVQTAPQVDQAVQEKRVEKPAIGLKPAAVGERRAAIDVLEARDKDVREKNSHPPEVKTQAMSGFDHRVAAIATSSDAAQNQRVSKYQDSLTAASASNMARFPAADRMTTTTINRFVFRKNPPESATTLNAGTIVTPAAGSSALRK